MSFGSGISWWGTRHRQGFWPRINCSQMKLPDFESPSGDSFSKSANFGLSKWIFYVKNYKISGAFATLKKNKVDFTAYPSNHFPGCRLNGRICLIRSPKSSKFFQSDFLDFLWSRRLRLLLQSNLFFLHSWEFKKYSQSSLSNFQFFWSQKADDCS